MTFQERFGTRLEGGLEEDDDNDGRMLLRTRRSGRVTARRRQDWMMDGQYFGNALEMT